MDEWVWLGGLMNRDMNGWKSKWLIRCIDELLHEWLDE